MEIVRCLDAIHEAEPPTAVDFGFREKVVRLTSLKSCLLHAGHFDYGGGRAGWTRSIMCLKEPVALSSLWQLADFNFTSTVTAGSCQTIDLKEVRVAR